MPRARTSLEELQAAAEEAARAVEARGDAPDEPERDPVLDELRLLQEADGDL